MTTIAPAQSLSGQQPRPPAGGFPPAPVPPVAAGGGTLDPIKLLTKYKWLLLAAAVLGGLIGVVSYYLFLQVRPVWTPKAIFKCLPAQGDPTVGGETLSNDVELQRFMQTQARLMTENIVLDGVARNPELQTAAKEWAKQFMTIDKSTGLERFDTAAALDELRDSVRSRVIPQTALIELSIGWRQPEDATAVCRLVTQQYQQVIRNEGDELSNDRTRQLEEAIERYTKQIQGVQRQKESMIRDQKLDSLSDKTSQTYAEVASVNEELLIKSQELQGVTKQLESMRDSLDASGGLAFPQDLVSEAEREPSVIESLGRVQLLEVREQSLINTGLPPAHRERRLIRNQLNAARAQLEDSRTRAVRKLYDGKVERLRQIEGSLQVQIADLQAQRTNLNTRLTDLTRYQSQLDDWQRQIDGLLELKNRATADLSKTISLAGLRTASRVLVQQPASRPNQISFPQLKLMVPAGVMLLTLLVGATIVLRELIDQRIKSPADITLIPRTRLLGWVPDSSEDPAGEGAAETAFRDRARGIVAESFRQIRSLLVKRVQQSGHRAVVVMAGMPGSGATTVVSNLAMAAAAAELRVLVIDANFRRPAIHRVFALQESPGLADVLARVADLDSCVQPTTTQNLSVLTVGTRDHRILERLSNESMTEILQLARLKYDLVLLDMAPAVVAGDGLAVANRCDASILVVRAFGETRGLVARIKNDLIEARSEFLGVIVNGVRSSSGGYIKGNIRVAHEYQQEETASRTKS